MKIMYVVLAILVIVSSAPVGSAAGFSDAVSISITNGILGSFIAVSDSIYSISGFDDTAGNNTVGAIYNIASYTPNPLDFEITHKFIELSKSIFKEVFRLLILLTAIAILVTHFKPDALQKIKELTGINTGSKAGVLIEKGIKAVIIAIFLYVFIYFVFDINNRLTKMVMFDLIDVVSPSADNVILYFAMALCYLLMCMFFLWRLLEVFLFCAFGYAIAIMFLSDSTKEKAEDLCMRFVQTVFFQFIMVLYFSASVQIIKALIDPVYSLTVAYSFAARMEMSLYVAMMLGGLYLGFKMMFGTKVIRWVGRKASVLV